MTLSIANSNTANIYCFLAAAWYFVCGLFCFDSVLRCALRFFHVVTFFGCWLFRARINNRKHRFYALLWWYFLHCFAHFVCCLGLAIVYNVTYMLCIMNLQCILKEMCCQSIEIWNDNNELVSDGLSKTIESIYWWYFNSTERRIKGIR